MTPARKEIIELLLKGHVIVAAGSRLRIRDLHGNPVRGLSQRNLRWLNSFDLLRQTRYRMAINKNKVRQWHGNSFIKRAYRVSSPRTITRHGMTFCCRIPFRLDLKTKNY